MERLRTLIPVIIRSGKKDLQEQEVRDVPMNKTMMESYTKISEKCLRVFVKTNPFRKNQKGKKNSGGGDVVQCYGPFYICSCM